MPYNSVYVKEFLGITEAGLAGGLMVKEDCILEIGISI